MRPSSDSLRRLALAPGLTGDPGFHVVVAFDYYDGPESGIGVYSDGGAVRLRSMGDSPSREQRAFELVLLPGDGWLSQLIAACEEASISHNSRVVVPSDLSGSMRGLKERAESALAMATFVCIGDPNLAQIAVREVSEAELAAVLRLDGSPDAFGAARALLAS